MLKRMTNRQLARWCSLGFGEVCIDNLVSTAYSYLLIAANDLVRPGVKIRRWGSNLWTDPECEEPKYEGHNI